ncbi:hypothetical protein D3C75_1076140 [compost metagenome]
MVYRQKVRGGLIKYHRKPVQIGCLPEFTDSIIDQTPGAQRITQHYQLVPRSGKSKQHPAVLGPVEAFVPQEEHMRQGISGMLPEKAA